MAPPFDAEAARAGVLADLAEDPEVEIVEERAHALDDNALHGWNRPEEMEVDPPAPEDDEP